MSLTLLVSEQLKIPDFLVSSRYFNVEYPNAKWGRLGESEEYFWETKTEQKSKEEVALHERKSLGAGFYDVITPSEEQQDFDR